MRLKNKVYRYMLCVKNYQVVYVQSVRNFAISSAYPSKCFLVSIQS